MSTPAPRRVVTGIGPDGRSCILYEGEVPQLGPVANLVWRTAAVPADNSDKEDAALPYSMDFLHDGGTNFIITEFPPGRHELAFMHATDTTDYLVVISGEITLVLEASETRCGPGTLIVDRGVIHGWRNDGTVPAVYASVTVPAKPVGKGRTL
jgi:mannose-6-phosphate isomerase-like protein (cupin superfamily)